MKKILTTISTLALLSSLHANESNTKDYFISVGGGYSHLSISKDGATYTKDLNSNGYNGVISAGLNAFDSLAFALNYQRVQLNDIHLDNVYVEANYNIYNKSEFTPFVGIQAGYSTLTWDKSPIVTVVQKSVSSGSFLGGVNAGINYAINDSFSIFALYQLQVMNHKTDIRQSGISSTIDNSIGSNINGGFKYSF